MNYKPPYNNIKQYDGLHNSFDNERQKKIIELHKNVRLSIIAGDIQQSRVLLDLLEQVQRDFEKTYDLT